VAPTLFDLTVMLARKLSALSEGVATGGSVSTLIDTLFLTHVDDFFNGGTVWVIQAGGVAPEGEAKRISDFVQSTATATLETALTTTLAAGDLYGIAGARYPLNYLIGKINQALVDMGPIPYSDISITSVAGQTEYDLPTVDANYSLRQVFEQRRAGAANDNEWIRRYDYHIQKKSSGVDKLVFDVGPISNRLLRLDYVYLHAEMYALSDVLNAKVHPALVVLHAAVGAVEGRLNDPSEPDAKLAPQLRVLREELSKGELDFPIERPHRTTKMLIIGPHLGARYPGDQTPR